MLYEGMAAEVRAAGNQIKLNAPAVRLERDGERVTRVAYREDGEEKTIDCDLLLSTLPLPALVTMTSPALPAAVVSHAAKLRYRSLKLIYIVLKRAQMTDYHWVYLLDEQFRVNRLSEQKNVSPEMVPPDSTVLCIELSLWQDEPLWKEIGRASCRERV